MRLCVCAYMYMPLIMTQWPSAHQLLVCGGVHSVYGLHPFSPLLSESVLLVGQTVVEVHPNSCMFLFWTNSHNTILQLILYSPHIIFLQAGSSTIAHEVKKDGLLRKTAGHQRLS